MKKVGIMTMHRVVNYGSFLQAYGLKKIIEGLGNSVEFVDFNIERSLVEEEKKLLLKKIKNNLNFVTFYNKKRCLEKFKKEYNDNYLPMLGVGAKNYNPVLDTLVIGSDEVFNCMQQLPVGYSRELFGKNYEKINVISYAGSFGHTTIKQLREKKIDKEIGDMFNKFKTISVRDENSKKIVESLSNKEAIIHFDPVLITNFDNVITNKVQMNNYIIVYAYTGRLSKFEEKYIKKFAKKYNKKIVSLGFYQKIADYNLVVEPFEMLENFKKSDYVITDTFHGTIFSIKMHAKFCTIIRDSNKNKLYYLLNETKQLCRQVNNLDDIERLYKKDMNFSETDKKINEERKCSIEYLKKNI